MKALTITINALPWIAAGLVVWALHPLLLKGITLAKTLHNAWPGAVLRAGKNTSAIPASADPQSPKLIERNSNSCKIPFHPAPASGAAHLARSAWCSSALALCSLEPARPSSAPASR